MAQRKKTKNELLVIENVDLIKYYNENVVVLGKKYQQMGDGRTTGLCPFHVDTDPSLHLWKKKNIFHCFGCNFGGDVVKTHIRLRKDYHNESMSIERAVTQLAQMYGIELLPEEEGFVEESPFVRARQLILDPSVFNVSKDELSLAEFKKLNARVKRQPMTLDQQIMQYQHLDLVASIHLSNH